MLPSELVNFEQLFPTRLDVITLNESKPGPPIQQTETYLKRASMRKHNKLCTHTHFLGSYAVSRHLVSHDGEAGAVTSLYLSMKRMTLS